MRIGFLAGLLVLSAQAWAWGGCEYEEELDQVLDVSGSRSLAVMALAGELEISGEKGLDEARIRGTKCASEKAWLAELGVETQSGEAAEISVRAPDLSGASSWGDTYAYVNLVLQVPEDLPLTVMDSSGDMELSNLSDVSIKDSSGDIELSNMHGHLRIQDTSGDVELEDLEGDLEIVSDSSGDVEAYDVTGSVTVRVDSSGDLEFSDIGGDVLVERDSSGDISVNGVGGSFTVLRDGSGSIDSSGVQGDVDIPD